MTDERLDQCCHGYCDMCHSACRAAEASELLAEVKRLRDAVKQAGSLFVLEQRRHVEIGQLRQTEEGWETTLSHSARIRLRSLQEAEAEGARREREKLAQEVEQWPPAAFLEGEPVVFQSVIAIAIRSRGDIKDSET